MQTFKVKSGVPAPDQKTYTYTGLTDALRSLPIGDSYIELPGDARANANSVAAAAKIKITTQSQPDGTIRIWRLPDDKENNHD